MKLKLKISDEPAEQKINRKLKISRTGIQVTDANGNITPTDHKSTPIPKSRLANGDTKFMNNNDPIIVKETITKLLDQMKQDYQFGPFLELVSKADYPSYFELIETPISLTEIQKKFDLNNYTSLIEFKQDVDLMFSNCFKFNQKQSDIYVLGQELKKKFQNMLLDSQSVQKRSLKSSGLLKRLSVGQGDDINITPGMKPKQSPSKRLKPTLETKTETPSKAKIVAKIPDPTNDIFSLIKQGSLEKFKEKVNDIKDLNFLQKTNMFDSHFTWGLLHACSYHGQQRMIDYLVLRKCDLELQDTWFGGVIIINKRPLAWASFGGHYNVCKRLIELGANKDATNLHGQTAFDLVQDKSRPWKELFLIKVFFLIGSGSTQTVICG